MLQLRQTGAANTLAAEAPTPSMSQQRYAPPDHDCELTEEELEACTALRGPQPLLVGAGNAPPGTEDASDTEDGVGGNDDDGSWGGGDEKGCQFGDGDEEERPLKRARRSADEEAQEQEQEQ
eukprot:m51a1_g11362 hypothetical protein (122) ;mRNA; f:34134-34645